MDQQGFRPNGATLTLLALSGVVVVAIWLWLPQDLPLDGGPRGGTARASGEPSASPDPQIPSGEVSSIYKVEELEPGSEAPSGRVSGPDSPSSNLDVSTYRELALQFVSPYQIERIESELAAFREAGHDFPESLDELLGGPLASEWHDVEVEYIESLGPPADLQQCAAEILSEMESGLNLGQGVGDLIDRPFIRGELDDEDYEQLVQLNDKHVGEIKAHVSEVLAPARQEMFALAWNSDALVRLPRWRALCTGFHVNAPRNVNRSLLQATNLGDWLVIIDVPEGRYPFYDQALRELELLSRSRRAAISALAAEFSKE